MKLYAAVAALASGGLLLAGLDAWPARLVAVVILATSCTAFGMILEAEPTTPLED